MESQTNINTHRVASITANEYTIHIERNEVLVYHVYRVPHPHPRTSNELFPSLAFPSLFLFLLFTALKLSLFAGEGGRGGTIESTLTGYRCALSRLSMRK